jgi:tetratricopeptide (TPR) repeat protein
MRNGFSDKCWSVGVACVFLVCFSIFAVEASGQKSVVPLRSITVVTEPDAIIWVDGVKHGTTDKEGKFLIKTVSAGKHSLRVRANGFKEISQNLLPAQKGEIQINLTKTTDQAELTYQEAEKLTTVDREKAAEEYRKAIKLRPLYPEAYLGLARVLSDMGDLDEALKAVVQARKLRPNYAEASAVEGRIHKDGGDEEKAIATFKRAITEGKGFQPEAYAGLGLIYKEKGEGFSSSGDFESEAANYAEASKYLRIALTQLSGAPDTIIIYQLEGLIYERMKKEDEAIKIYEEFLRLFPDTVEASAVQSFITQIRKRQADQP